MTKPKIFVFCNSCQPDWHNVQALSEDGCFITGHICSNHCFIPHDMGLEPNGWKRDIYDKHYPEGYEVVWIEDARNPPPEFTAAYERHKAWGEKEYKKRMSVHESDNQPSVQLEITDKNGESKTINRTF